MSAPVNRWRAITAAALAAALLAGCTTAASGKKSSPPAPAPPQTQTPPPAGLESYYQQKPNWTGCQEGFECTKVKVPLSYSQPQGDKLELALIRLPAKNTSRRIGSLLTNPGGPGGSGVNFVRQAARAFGPDLLSAFDLVGFDPRGVAQSEPVRCLDGPQIDGYFGTDATPDDRAEAAALLDGGRRFATGCRTRSGPRLPYVGTVNAARDMDVLRAALGDSQLTYAGFSYGTYLGAFYAEQFPKNVRALVLDGAVDPSISATDTLLEQSKGFETALRAFAADCVKQPTCPLGAGTVDSALDAISKLQRDADRTPLLNSPDQRRIDESWVTLGIGAALYDKNRWPTLREALTDAINARSGARLLQLADGLLERHPDGTYSNQSEANMAVNCVDKPNPPNATAFQAELNRAKKAAPHFGALVMRDGLACVYWPVQTKQAPRPLSATGAKPILVIGTTRDPATPYRWAQALASQLKSGVLLTNDGDGHTAYLGGSACITSATERYLLTTTPPQDGTVCR